MRSAAPVRGWRPEIRWIPAARRSVRRRLTAAATPPTQNTDCQPKAGMIQDANSPPTKPPSGKPAHNSATITARSRRGEYSEVRLMKLGMAPPRPRPARKRNTTSTPKLGASAVAMVNRPKQPVAPISTVLRPIRSAKSPKPKAPKARPAKAALNTMRSDGSGMCRSAAMPEAASPIDCRSMPSSKATNVHSTMTRTWNAPTGRVSISSETLNAGPDGMLRFPSDV